MRVLAYHLILANYGFWLPNEPRGSRSSVVRAFELLAFGPATKVNTTRSVAHKPYDRNLRRKMDSALARDPVIWNGKQARAVARGFANYCERSGCTILACSIMPRHTHAVVLRHACSIEQVARLLKGDATRELSLEGLHPFQNDPYTNGNIPSPWTRHSWAPFLWNSTDIRRGIEYVQQNPVRDGFKKQNWSFVQPYHVLEKI